MKDVKYVRIVKCHYPNAWYAQLTEAQPIYEVLEYAAMHETYKTLHEGLAIYKSDCEEVAITPQPQQEVPELSKDLEQAAHIYAKANKHNSKFAYDDIYPAFIAGAEWADNQARYELPSDIVNAFDEFRKLNAGNYSEVNIFCAGAQYMQLKQQQAKPQQEGYTITAEQIKELGKMLGPHPILEKWFPEVFQPVKTYKVKDRFRHQDARDNIYTIIEAGLNTIALLVNTDFIYQDNFTTVGDKNAITEEDFNRLTKGYVKYFTLIE